MLERYHAELVARGVSDYSWNDFCNDYRAGIIYWLLVPIQDAHDGAAPAYWTPKLTCLTEAFLDLGLPVLAVMRRHRPIKAVR